MNPKCLECDSEEATIEELCFACWMLVGDEDIPKPTEDEFGEDRIHPDAPDGYERSLTPRPNDGMSYRFDYDSDEWVDPMDPETGLRPGEGINQ